MDTTCSICFDKPPLESRAFPNKCEHVFCIKCIKMWAKHENYCPLDYKRFNKIILPFSGESVKVARRKKKKKSELFDFTVYCELCSNDERGMQLLMCDSCDLGFHLTCLKPPLEKIPSGSWDCPTCRDVDRRRRKLENFLAKESEKRRCQPSLKDKSSDQSLTFLNENASAIHCVKQAAVLKASRSSELYNYMTKGTAKRKRGRPRLKDKLPDRSLTFLNENSPIIHHVKQTAASKASRSSELENYNAKEIPKRKRGRPRLKDKLVCSGIDFIPSAQVHPLASKNNKELEHSVKLKSNEKSVNSVNINELEYCNPTASKVVQESVRQESSMSVRQEESVTEMTIDEEKCKASVRKRYKEVFSGIDFIPSAQVYPLELKNNKEFEYSVKLKSNEKSVNSVNINELEYCNPTASKVVQESVRQEKSLTEVIIDDERCEESEEECSIMDFLTSVQYPLASKNHEESEQRVQENVRQEKSATEVNIDDEKCEASEEECSIMDFLTSVQYPLASENHEESEQRVQESVRQEKSVTEIIIDDEKCKASEEECNVMDFVTSVQYPLASKNHEESYQHVELKSYEEIVNFFSIYELDNYNPTSSKVIQDCVFMDKSSTETIIDDEKRKTTEDVEMPIFPLNSHNPLCKCCNSAGIRFSDLKYAKIQKDGSIFLNLLS